MIDQITSFLKEKGVSENIVSSITEKLQGVNLTDMSNLGQVQEIFNSFKDKIPSNVMEQIVPMISNLFGGNMPGGDILNNIQEDGNLIDKAKNLLGGVFGG
jgi:hypothetical protein